VENVEGIGPDNKLFEIDNLANEANEDKQAGIVPKKKLESLRKYCKAVSSQN
jgi:hypothetical protein